MMKLTKIISHYFTEDGEYLACKSYYIIIQRMDNLLPCNHSTHIISSIVPDWHFTLSASTIAPSMRMSKQTCYIALTAWFMVACCVFRPANRCFACCLLVKLFFTAFKQTEKINEKVQKITKNHKKCIKR